MHRSQIFDLKNPRPLDAFLYPLYKQFVGLQKKVITAWKSDIVSGLLADRSYMDFADTRADVSKDGSLIIRFKPIIGEEQEEELRFLNDFFILYARLSNVLVEKIASFFATQTLPLKVYVESNKTAATLWRRDNRYEVHKLIMTLQVLVTTMNMGKLTHDDLSGFEAYFGDDQASFIAAIDAIAREYEIGGFLSSEFQEGNASFFHYPNQDLVHAYWNRSHRVFQYWNVKVTEKLALG